MRQDVPIRCRVSMVFDLCDESDLDLMTFNKLFLIFMLLNTTLQSLAQDLEQHRWKDRVILISSDDQNNLTYRKQIEELMSDPKALADRRMIVYRILSDKYAPGLNSDWIFSEGLFSKYVNMEQGFNFVLIGLDGGVKVSRKEMISNDELFAIIDAMPMRRAELDRIKN